MPNNLSRYFQDISAKRLSTVDVEPARSNQHEINTVREQVALYGSEDRKFRGHFIYVSDDEEQVIEEQAELTYYDSRRKNPDRSPEYRIYYPPNSVIEKAQAGDMIVMARTSPDDLVMIIAPQDSTAEHQLLWLFGLEEVGRKFVTRDFTEDDRSLGFAGRYIIEALGIEVTEAEPDYLDGILSTFGAVFPSTAQFSAYARSTLPEVESVGQPDAALMAWLEREELLFRTLENHLVGEKLAGGFADVDDFISVSLSVQNRRKSRAGSAFENHLSLVFNQHGIAYSRGQKTERNNKPDFLFPGIDQYRDDAFSVELLTMLGVKTSAKDRWRQVLPEADRIERKHLMTLEPAISRNQTDEMIVQKLQLVIPNPLMETYHPDQQANLMDLAGFIDHVREKQKRD